MGLSGKGQPQVITIMDPVLGPGHQPELIIWVLRYYRVLNNFIGGYRPYKFKITVSYSCLAGRIRIPATIDSKSICAVYRFGGDTACCIINVNRVSVNVAPSFTFR